MFIIYFVLFVIVIALPWLNGVLDLYMGLRFARDNATDKTNAPLNWIALKWLMITKLEMIVTKLPFLRKDLSEIFLDFDDDITS